MDIGEVNWRLFLDGDESGLVELIRIYKDGLILYLNTYVANLTVAEELCEDTFVRLGVNRPRYSGKASFKTWLYTIARNIAVDHLRASARKNTVPLDECLELCDDGPSLAESYIKQEDKLTVHRTMARLKPEHRQVLWLVYFEDLSPPMTTSATKTLTSSPETTTDHE